MSWNHRLIFSSTFAVAFIIALSMFGCTQYRPQSTVIPIENLAQYNPKIFSKRTVLSKKAVPLEDEWIIRAIWFEDQGKFKRSNEYYTKLYEATGKEEYLLKLLHTASMAGIPSPYFPKLIEYIKKYPENIQAKRLLLSSKMKHKKYQEAKKIAGDLVSKSSHPVDYELAANPYIFTGNYSKAVELLTEAYKRTHNEDILFKITTLYTNYLNDIASATKMLEEHRIKQRCSEKICLQLAGIYSQQENIEKLTSIYKNLYKATRKEIYAQTLIETYMYQKNLPASIKFLETEYKNNEVLYRLYIQNKDYLKAEQLIQPLLTATKNPKWYAESAIVLYEKSPNPHKPEILNKVIGNFEIAIKKGVKNPVYFNYYGYTLINEEIDIPKGMSLLKKALDQEPNNTYYLDSLAWGYYKLNNCKKAYSIMKKVIEIEGLEEVELIEHWDAIKAKCNQ